MKSNNPPIFENDDLRVAGDEKIIERNIDRSKDMFSAHSGWYQDDKLTYGYRPFGIFIMGTGFVAVIAGIVLLIAAIAHLSLTAFTYSALLFSTGLPMMWYGIGMPFRHFVIFDRANGLVHVSRRLCWWRYISLRWQDVSFVNGHWFKPEAWTAKQDYQPDYDIRLLMPPTSLARLGIITYALQGVDFYSGATIGDRHGVQSCANSDPTWCFVVLFMCYGPSQHSVIKEFVDGKNAIREDLYNGSWRKMQESYMLDLPFWGRWMSHFRMPDLPDTPTHIVDDNGKWRKLKQNERAAHRTGPRWKHIKPEHDAILR
ncbi:MAG: hypothetical protein CTY21_12165 [Methylomonas sp.]|nr:MAG: hypothetical protein CTY21_12165 [Methylomonas sp.]